MDDLTPDFSTILLTKSKVSSVIRAMGVERYHTVPEIPRQNLGEHSAKVAMILITLFPSARSQVTQAALIHDLGEIVTGDIPYTTKALLPKQAMNSIDVLEKSFLYDFVGINIEITAAEKAMVKFCDYLELTFYCDAQSQTFMSFNIGARGFDLATARLNEMSPTAIADLKRTFDEATANSFNRSWARVRALELRETIQAHGKPSSELGKVS